MRALCLGQKHNIAARRVAKQMQKEGGVSKVYVARVVGAFPAQPTRCDAPLSWSHTEQRALVDEGEANPNPGPDPNHNPNPHPIPIPIPIPNPNQVDEGEGGKQASTSVVVVLEYVCSRSISSARVLLILRFTTATLC